MSDYLTCSKIHLEAKKHHKHKMEIETGIVIYLHLIWITSIEYTFNVAGHQDFATGKCISRKSNCSQYILCTDDLDNHIYPGRIKTLVQDLYIPRGLTINASTFIVSPTDRSLIIAGAYLAFKDDSLTMTKGKYTPTVTTVPGKRVRFSTDAVYTFGDIVCNGTREFVTESTVTGGISTVSTISYDSNHSTGSTNDTDSTTSSYTTTVNIIDNSTGSSTDTDSTTSSYTTTVNIIDNSTGSSTDTDSTTSSYITTADTMDNSTGSSNDTASTTPTIVPEDPCTFCLVQLAVEYLMADMTGVAENSTRTVTATLTSENVTIEVATILVLRPMHNASKMSNFTTDIADVTEYPRDSGKTFKLKTMFPNPLSSYQLVLKSQDAHLRIAVVRIVSVGEHYKDIIEKTKGPSPDDKSMCAGGPDTQIIKFGYLPNRGAYDNASTSADMVEFEVSLLMMGGRIGDAYPLHIDLEVDFVLIVNATKYFNTTDGILKKKIVVSTSAHSSLISISGTSSARLTWMIPPLSSGNYKLSASTKRYSGPGGDGLMIAGIGHGSFGSNIQCIAKSKHWKMGHNGKWFIWNIPYTSSTTANKFSYAVDVIALPNVVKAYSSHEITAILTYPGEGSPQVHKFYFNITNHQITTTPNRLQVYLNEECQSITHSTEVTLILHTVHGRRYGRLFVEFPMPAGTFGQSFALCSFGNIWRGHNVLGHHYTTITKRDDGLIEKVLVDISPLTNIFYASSDGLTVNYFKMNMVVTYIDKSLEINTQSMSFTARVISNNRTIWTGNLPIIKPSIDYHPEFTVVTNIEKLAGVNAPNLWFYYSLNGSYYNREALLWNGKNVYWFEFPKVIAYYYFLADPCAVICNVTTKRRPLRDYVTIVKDVNNTMLRRLPYALDQDINTCFDLPVPGGSPSLFWLRIIRLSLFGVTSKRFEVHVIGEGIECDRLGQKSVQVGTSGPAYSDRCSIESDIGFCKLRRNTTNALTTQCDIACECETLLQCSNVHIVLKSANKDVWRLCELTIEDV